ncbi:MAG TPA: cupin domain-containing protein [Steroidobacteraceae bacterium]|nr:cupin domain-containing protein [Steroidobacteraceae bacterium]
MIPTPRELIAKLALEPHQEGGWFRQVYKSATEVQAPQGRRSAVTSIYYLLEQARACPWHVVESDEIWHFYHGGPCELLSYDPGTGRLVRHRLDSVGTDGVQVAVIPAGSWQAAHSLGEYTLVGCTVSPGYENQDFRWVRELPDYRRHFMADMAALADFL